MAQDYEPLTIDEKMRQEADIPEKESSEKDAEGKKPGKLNIKHMLIKVQGGRMYLPVTARLVAFRHEHPTWGINTINQEVNWEKNYAVFRCEVRDELGRLVATGHKREDKQGFGDFYEKAETGSIGRALGVLGYGTEYLSEFNEVTPEQAASGEGRYADAPKPDPNARPEARADSRGTDSRGPHSAPQRQQQAHGQPAPADSPPACVNCGKALTKAQSEFSVRNYGEKFCPACQRDRPKQPAQGQPAQSAPAQRPAQNTNERPVNANGDTAGAVGAMQGQITRERKRIWGDGMDGDPPYRHWLQERFGLHSLAGVQLRILKDVHAALQQEPVFDDPFADDDDALGSVPANSPDDLMEEDPFGEN